MFSIPSELAEAYWWPLFFEAMRRIGFGFGNPFYLPKRRGLLASSGTSERLSEPTVIDSATFREMWTVVYSEGINALVEFWAYEGESFSLEGEIRRRDIDLIGVDFMFPAESLPDPSEGDDVLPVRALRQRLSSWLRGIEEIFALCRPCVADIAWERWGDTYTVGTVDSLSNSDTATAKFMGSQAWSVPTTSFIERHLADDAAIFLLDPFPVPWRGGWSFVSLRQP